MSVSENTTVPTLSKAKISHLLSYPVGAEAISAALTAAPQFACLKIHFYHWSDFHLRNGHYEFLRVEYLKEGAPATEWPVSELFQRPPQWNWEIVVQPVPRVFRHAIRKYIIDVALPQTAQWLTERSSRVERGSEILAFFYDEKSEQFVPRQLS